MDKNYGGVIWTNHALARLKERGIKQGDAWATFNRPDSSEFSKNKEAYVYTRQWSNETIEIVAKKNNQSKWIILSAWSKKIETKKVDKEKTSLIRKFLYLLLGKQST